MNGFYVTTAIPYVNGSPHLGHVLELVQADVLARHRRLRGQPVRFLTGTDENAVKNVAAARAAGLDVAGFVAGNAQRFAELRGPLSLSFDDFIRTSSDPRHAAGVERLWRRSAANGDLYRRRYTGRYCLGCERFYRRAELVEGRCPEHDTVAEAVVEENWFFRLRRYAPAVAEAIGSGRVHIEPAARRNEVLAFLRGGVEDISVSRPAARTQGWGISVPGDPDQVVYVWWDALANYLTALDSAEAYRTWWVDSAERVHLVGKGIARFHAVHWLALLISQDLPLPTTIVVHEYLTVDGVKISKSRRNGVDPVGLVERFGVDAVRWWLLCEVRGGTDTDFTVARLAGRADRDLANGLGNLVNRTVTLAHRHGLGPHDRDVAPALTAAVTGLAGRIDTALRRFDFAAATDAIRDVVEHGNRAIEQERPWALARRADDPRAQQRLRAVLGGLVTACRVLARECAPFLPDGAARLRGQLGAGDRVGPAHPAFARLHDRAVGTVTAAPATRSGRTSAPARPRGSRISTTT